MKYSQLLIIPLTISSSVLSSAFDFFGISATSPNYLNPRLGHAIYFSECNYGNKDPYLGLDWDDSLGFGFTPTLAHLKSTNCELFDNSNFDYHWYTSTFGYSPMALGAIHKP